MNNRTNWLMAAVASVGLVGGVVAATTSDSSTAAPSAQDSHGGYNGEHGWRHRGHRGHRGHGGHFHRARRAHFLLGGALRRLNLTADQRDQVHQILKTARSQSASLRQSVGQNFAALHNPGDPNYAAALQAAQTRASNLVAQRSQIDKQIYGVLTPAQKAQLPQVLASIQTRIQQHTGARTAQ
ncbi:MAG: Spy/CpxP family protein refolding chaperone [Steroidobacteraceae bacterium]